MRQSLVFNQMYENSLASIEPTIEFDVSKVKSDVFLKVVDWCEQHEGRPVPTVEVDPHTRERRWFTFDEYEKEFFKLPVEALEEVLMAANFLDIPSLYLCGCQAMAAVIKDKSPEEIRSLLGLPDDLTDEEKDAIRKENIWCSQ
ncbi:E3 ubiquitin ligase complex SCF subunit [Aphelenchoides fujianensis]|nr:E3 ubiquitin ligase complex SCF subunit [Aphelenchoides fujianensis]